MRPDEMKRSGLAGTSTQPRELTADTGIIRFPQPKVTCIGCGIRFFPRRHWHRVCPTCWAYHRAITATLAARDALHGGAA